MNIYVVSLGCAKNQVDTEKMLGSLLQEGCEIVGSPEEADLMLVNTCAFITEARDEASAVIIELVSQKKPGQKLIVTGCFVNYYGENILKERQCEVDCWLPVASEENILKAVGKLFGEKAPAAQIPYGPRVRITPPHYGFLRVADGCEHKCAFCSIPRLRGGMVSEPVEKLVAEARKMAEEGVVELNVIAQDTSAYPELPKLLKKLCAIDDLYWIRLQYLYPATMSDELIDVIAKEEKICKYIDLPLQHVNEDVLKAMRRPTHAFTEKLLDKILNKIPDATLRTTFITGFPGETKEAFEELEAFVKKGLFHHMGVFAYSLEEATPAFPLGDPIPQEVKEGRADILMRAQKEISLKKNRSYIGRTVPVIIDRKEKDRGFGRRTADAPDVDNEVIVRNAKKIPLGSIVPVKITGAASYDVTGTAMLEGLI
ncbi:30S ribosomal protein S12 methylthiotransferase RimO [bacterium]|nr:30S ribosomal protein S12 methylthiotransferase RimO [bacterium]